MNDKLLILEDTDGDGKADKMHRLRRRPALPDRLRVLQRRRPRRPGARPDVPQGHRRRRQGRRPRPRPRRPRLGRHAPHVQQLSARPGRRPSTSRRARSTTRRSRRPTARRCAMLNAGVFRYEPRTQKFDVYVTYGFANPHGHVFDRWGQDIVVDGTGADPYSRHPVLRPPRLSRTSTAGPPQVYQQRTRPMPRHRDPDQPALPRENSRATCSSPT